MWFSVSAARNAVNRIALAVLGLIVAAAPVFSEDTSLAGLIQAGNRKAALERIDAGAGVNEAQADGTTPLHWAVYRSDYELVEALLAHGAKVNAANQFGAWPLAEAVKLADVRLVRLLLDAKADVEAMNEDGQTALMLAVRNGSLAVADLLVRAGADVNAVEKWRRQTPLMWAAARNAPDIVKFLIAKGAKVNVRAMANDWPSQITSEPRAQYRPTGGLTALLYAARAGCKGCVEALVDGGADINLPTPDGVTALMLAIDNGNYDVARYLLERGANPHVWDWWGRTALYIAVDMRSRAAEDASGATSGFEVIQMLLNAGVNPNPQLNMHRPSRGGNSGRFVDDLLTTGATPLLRAAQLADVEVVRELLQHGALADLPNAMGVTPLMAAAGVGLGPPVAGGVNAVIRPPASARVFTTLDLLLQAGADINARITDTSSYTARIARRSSMTDRQGQTALFAAAQSTRADVVRYLLEHGAKIDVVDDMGRTPLDAASGNGGGRGGQGSEEVRTLLRNAASKSN
jgi:ankyrin repeat protein